MATAKKTSRKKPASRKPAARKSTARKEGVKADGTLKKGFKYVKGGRVVKAKAKAPAKRAKRTSKK